VRWVLLFLLGAVIALAVGRELQRGVLAPVPQQASAPPADGRIFVGASESIADALQSAPAGATIVVEPGEYRETLTLRSHVRLVSRVRHGAVIRLPGNASEADAAVVARDVTDAVLEGFRVVGDAATPLGTGVAVANSQVTLSDMEVSGAARTAVDVDATSTVRLSGSDIRDNPGAALVILGGANATISHNVFVRNGSAGGPRGALIIDASRSPTFIANVFLGVSPDVLAGSTDARAALARDNWFVDARTLRVMRPRPGSR
jgi:hypothetical protein